MEVSGDICLELDQVDYLIDDNAGVSFLYRFCQFESLISAADYHILNELSYETRRGY